MRKAGEISLRKRKVSEEMLSPKLKGTTLHTACRSIKYGTLLRYITLTKEDDSSKNELPELKDGQYTSIFPLTTEAMA